MSTISFLDRIGRPLTRLSVLALMCAVTWFAIQFGDVAVDGLRRWSRGEGVDMGGFAQVLTAFSALMGVLIIHIVSLFRDRRLERVEEIRARGGAPTPDPFGPGRDAPLPPSSDASGEAPTPDTWPRPAENQA